MDWTPDNPAWSRGTADVYMAELETAETTRQFLRHRWSQSRPPTVLDVGAGSGYWSHQLFGAQSELTMCDIVPSPGIESADVRDLPYDTDNFDFVHARRVISNLELGDRARGLAELRRVARQAVLLVDVFDCPYLNIQSARCVAGLPALERHMGRGPLNDEVRETAARDLPIGTSYYVWTRLTLPAMLGHDVPFGAGPIRLAYPQLNPRAVDVFGVHRLVVLSKVIRF